MGNMNVGNVGGNQAVYSGGEKKESAKTETKVEGEREVQVVDGRICDFYL